MAKTVIKRTIIVIIFAVLVLILVFFSFFTLKNIFGSSKPPAATLALELANPSKQKFPLAGLPTRLKIPKINVDAPIDYMGILPNGLLEAPSVPKNVGWYKFGPRPGNMGNAVIDGHYGIWENGERTVFDNLNQLAAGDKVFVEDDKGGFAVFAVRESKSFNPNSDSSEVFKSNDGLAHLNLITCDGSWNTASESYSKRLVVFTDRLQ